MDEYASKNNRGVNNFKYTLKVVLWWNEIHA